MKDFESSVPQLGSMYGYPGSSKLFWIMNGKKTLPSIISPSQNEEHNQDEEADSKTNLEKREISSYTNWGSNPYLLGKRPYNSQFWTARGKKSSLNDEQSMIDNNADFPEISLATDGTNENENAFNYAIPLIIDSSQVYSMLGNEFSGGSPPDQQTLSHPEYLSDFGQKRRDDRLFWASRGKRPYVITDDDKEMDHSATKRANPNNMTPLMKNVIATGKNVDKSKFWMSRGRRFWAARGKKASDSASTFSRLSRLVNSGIKSGQFFAPGPVVGQKGVNLFDIGLDPTMTDKPNFWVVRGKKSTLIANDGEDSTTANEPDGGLAPLSENGRPSYMQIDFIRDKKRLQHLSALAHMNGPLGGRASNFWASRGRKNFWAARGKRSLPDSS